MKKVFMTLTAPLFLIFLALITLSAPLLLILLFLTGCQTTLKDPIKMGTSKTELKAPIMLVK